MADDDDDRPSLQAPQLFGRRRAARTPAQQAQPAQQDDGSAVTEERALFADAGDPTAVLPATPEPTRRVRRARRTGDVDVVDTPLVTPAGAPRAPRAPRTPRDRSRPLLPGRQAAAVVGVLAGLSLVGFTWVGFRGCEALRGTTSCGPGPGMAALAVVFVAAVVVGGYLLSWFRIPDPGATSFLAMGLTAVFCLVFLVDHLDHWSMVIVIPAVSAATYLLSWWVTTTYVDTD